MMCLSLVLVVMSVSGLVTAIPTMQEELNASASQIQWILDAYAIVFAGSLLTAGALGDRFGRKRALLAGLVVFGVGALFAGVASGAEQVIVGRAVMGIGAALVMPATLSIITTIFPPEERSRAIAVWAGFAGAGGAIGPDRLGRAARAVLVGLGGARQPAAGRGDVRRHLDLRPGVARRDEDAARSRRRGAVARRAWARSCSRSSKAARTAGATTQVAAASVIALVTLAAFVQWERRSAHPMLPLTLFRDRRLSIGSGVVTVAFFVMFGFFFLATQYLQFARGYSPLEAGLALAAAADHVRRALASQRGARRPLRRAARDGRSDS